MYVAWLKAWRRADAGRRRRAVGKARTPAAAWELLDAMAPLVEPVPVEVEVRIGATWVG